MARITIALPKHTAYPVEVSFQCSAKGDGDCDGFDYSDSNAGVECECPCHYHTNLPTYTQGVKEWHEEMHATGGASVDEDDDE